MTYTKRHEETARGIVKRYNDSYITGGMLGGSYELDLDELIASALAATEAELVGKLLTPSRAVEIAMCDGRTWLEDWQLGIKAFARENGILIPEEKADE